MRAHYPSSNSPPPPPLIVSVRPAPSPSLGQADSTQLLYKKIRQGLPSLPESLSPAAASLLSGMLAVEPSKRMTLVQVAQHEWPQLQANAPPLIISQTVAAAVDDAACASLRLSASNLFRLGSDASSSDEAQLLDANRLRRAFTFDHLPAGSDEQCDALLSPPPPLPWPRGMPPHHTALGDTWQVRRPAL